ncbi:DUF6049 family protein [Leucobacter rhizosphaerae]|uniref:DUF6049 family protein n=1 Tax=Leucobacter rhizosphaerae TaxID=2932245 RepID=A0ABY4FST4_9MICO|nr:DUF6049 family protein [Leucobacter rhizosphaerae]UOQ59353.1 DUF6049 family protein [Leucobacter rhizosphaerae]
MAFPSLPRRSAWRGAAAGLAALALVVGGATAATAEAPAGRPAEVGDPPTGTSLPTLIMSPLEPVLGDSADDVSVGVVVRNPGDEPIPAGELRVELNPQRVETIAGLDEEFPVSGELLAESAIGSTAAESEQSVTVTIAREDLPLTALIAPGVYQLRATLTPESGTAPVIPEVTGDPGSDPEAAEAGDSATAETDALRSAAVPFVWRESGGSDVEVSVIVPLVLPTDIRTLPTRDQLSDLVPRLDRLLTAATAQRATLAIDPRIIAGIRAYGDEAPLLAQRFLSRLESSSLPGFLLQFADADPAAQAALGFTTLLEPTNLDFVSRFGVEPAQEPADELPDEPADDPAEDDTVPTVLPTLSELLAWSEEAPTAWPAEGAVDEGTLQLLEANGISDVVLTSDNVTQEGGPRVTLGRSDALVTDARLGAAARRALAAPNDTERAAAVSEIAARLALAAETDVPGVILGLDRGAIADAENPEQLLEDIGDLDWVAATPHTEQATGTASLKSADTLEERRELLRTAVNREGAVDEVGAILIHPEYLSGYQRTRLLDLFATRYAASDADFPAVATTFRMRDAELMEGVRAVSTEHTQLVGASTRVPVQLRNSLPFEALVSVRVDPASAALTVPERSFADVRVRPEGTEQLLVPVQSRVSSGESGLVVSIADVSGDWTIFTGTLSITIRSGVETIAIWTLGGLAALLLGFGIWRSVRRRRHRRRAPELTAA